MSFIIDIQVVTTEPAPELPDTKAIQDIVSHILAKFKKSAELCIRIVDDREITALNNRYRNKNKPTNVLSFPSELPEGIELECELLGDIIIASNIVKQESIMQHKTFEQHFVHMLIHGTLHLLGFDHINNDDAKKMEGLEIQYMNELNFNNPY